MSPKTANWRCAEEDFLRNWAKFMDSKVRDNQSSIGDTIKHLRELNANARQDQYHSKAYIPELGLRDRILPTDGAEKAVFPVEMLPRFHTGYFIGRQKDIDRIHAWLDHSEPAKIRKYHVYGRRGIGNLPALRCMPIANTAQERPNSHWSTPVDTRRVLTPFSGFSVRPKHRFVRVLQTSRPSSSSLALKSR